MSKTNSRSNSLPRTEALRLLIRGERPITELRGFLSKFEFDSEPLVVLTINDLRMVLRRFLQGEISGKYMEEWANLIELRDDIEFDKADEERIKRWVHDLANPVLSGPLNKGVAQEILKQM